MPITPKHCQTLELPKVLELLAGFTNCEQSRDWALGLQPHDNYVSAVKEMTFTADAHRLTNRFGYPVFYKIKNCAGALKRAELGSSLTLRELLDIALILKTTRGLAAWKAQAEGDTALDPAFECLYQNHALETRLTNSIVSEEELDDNASGELADIRRKIRNSGLKIRSQLDSMIRSPQIQKYLQDPIVTIRDGRFVIPVKAEYRGEIRGLVHDTSSSGATFFVEPMSVVEANNEIKILENKERIEIERIIAELSAAVGECAGQIGGGYDAAAELDLYFAKSRLADRMRASVPELGDGGETVLKKARHPLINADKAVPIDIALGGEYDTLVITGPNTGGKTVAIKTLGLLSLMAACGLMIPASDGSRVAVYDSVLADIGDEQSIEQSLSTFSSHMVNIISIVREAGPGSLVLLDELGAGTDPVEGAALAVSIIETLRRRGARIAATTHYPEVKMYALETPGVENASSEFDVKTLSPTYRLITGIPGRSNAFLISGRLGLDPAVIERAKELISSENTRFEEVVSELERTRQTLDEEHNAARLARVEAERIRAEAEAQRSKLEADRERELEKTRRDARRIIEETKLRAEILYEELDEIKKQKDKEDFGKLLTRSKAEYRSAMKELDELSDPVVAREAQPQGLPRPLEKGDIVYVHTLGKEAMVLKKPDGNSVQVQAGILKVTVPIADVSLGAPKKQKDKPAGPRKRGVSLRGVASKAERNVQTELDIRGCDSEEGVMELNAFLDRAVLSGVKSVRIIHGKGTGVLRAAVQQRLRQHPSVESFRLGVYGEGENGVTIATLK